MVKSLLILVCISLLLSISLNTLPACSRFQPSNTDISLVLGASGDCNASLNSDFDARTKWAVENPFNPCNVIDTWGAWQSLYTQATIPSNCNQINWQQQRILLAIDNLVSKGWNYCHHHDPYWLPPNDAKDRITIDPNTIATANDNGICSLAGLPGGVFDPTSDKGWLGLDCTHYTSYVYNFAFGAFLRTNTGDQACSINVPGKILNISASQQNLFLPGDVLYIAASSTANPMTISHGVLWTGYWMDYDNVNYPQFSKDNLLKNLVASQQTVISKYIQENPNVKIYVISDSHYAGPNYRPFAGWYSDAFVHARRIIGSSSIPRNLVGYPSGRYIYNYTELAGTCQVMVSK